MMLDRVQSYLRAPDPISSVKMTRVPSDQRELAGYEVLFPLGSGGTASVHLARKIGPGGFRKQVAIKRIHPHLLEEALFTRMLLDEARLAAMVTHPNVVPVLDVGETESEIYLVIEYVHGEPLSRLLGEAQKRGERMHPAIAVRIAVDFLRGLHAAHIATDEQGERLNIVHRDVSPQNLLVGSNGVTRVVDFGVAKASGRLQTTMDGCVKGKLAYMAPEQMGGTQGPQSDQYAAAAVLWEMLVGERLVSGESDAELIHAVLRGGTIRVSDKATHVSAALSGAVMRALAKAPHERFATAEAMAKTLEGIGPIASAEDVAAWVEHLAGEALAARAKRIAAGSPSGRKLDESVTASGSIRIPSQGASSSYRRSGDSSFGINGLPQTPLSISLGATGSAVSMISTEPFSDTMVTPIDFAMRSPWPARLAVFGVLLSLMLGVLLWVSSGRGTRKNATTGLPSAALSAGNEEGRTAHSFDPQTTTGTASGPTGTLIAPPSGQPGTPVAPALGSTHIATTSAGAVGKPRFVPVTQQPKRNNCNPPFVIDAEGSRRYKRECLE